MVNHNILTGLREEVMPPVFETDGPKVEGHINLAIT